jgi:hypothetical protein
MNMNLVEQWILHHNLYENAMTLHYTINSKLPVDDTDIEDAQARLTAFIQKRNVKTEDQLGNTGDRKHTDHEGHSSSSMCNEAWMKAALILPCCLENSVDIRNLACSISDKSPSIIDLNPFHRAGMFAVMTDVRESLCCTCSDCTDPPSGDDDSCSTGALHVNGKSNSNHAKHHDSLVQTLAKRFHWNSNLPLPTINSDTTGTLTSTLSNATINDDYHLVYSSKFSEASLMDLCLDPLTISSPLIDDNDEDHLDNHQRHLGKGDVKQHGGTHHNHRENTPLPTPSTPLEVNTHDHVNMFLKEFLGPNLSRQIHGPILLLCTQTASTPDGKNDGHAHVGFVKQMKKQLEFSWNAQNDAMGYLRSQRDVLILNGYGFPLFPSHAKPPTFSWQLS